ncbi:unnamed protein product [Scytosiphon promiscuus]
MIPGIPSSWPALSPSPSSPQTPSSSSTTVQAGELDMHAHGGGGGGSGNTNTSTPKVKPAAVPVRPQASRPPPTTAYSSSPLSSPPSPPSPPPPAGRGRSARPGKKPKKQHLRRADSPPPARWNASPAAATNPVKKSPSSGTGKRGVEMPPSCGPVRAGGGGPAEREQQKRRDEKIQRYLYKRSRRKFAKFTRDASPSRSRPKAAALRPRVKGKFVKTVPDFISVNAGQQPGEEMGGGTASNGGMSMEAGSNSKIAASVRYPALAQGGGGFGGRCGGGGGGVRSVRNGGSVNVNFDDGKAFSSTPSSSLMPRGVVGGGVHPPQASALAPGASNTMSMPWSTGPSPMSM